MALEAHDATLDNAPARSIVARGPCTQSLMWTTFAVTPAAQNDDACDKPRDTHRYDPEVAEDRLGARLKSEVIVYARAR